MTAVELNIDLAQNRTFELVAAVLASDGVTPRDDLAGWTGAMQIRDSRSTAATLLAEADVTVDATTGTVTARVPAADTDGATWRSGAYDLYITNGTAREDLAYGVARLRRAVTA